jgi:hypothetical protein
VTLSSLPWPLRELTRVKARVGEFGDPEATDARFAQLARGFAAMGRLLHDRAPASRVVAVDYLTVLPPEGQNHIGPPPAAIADWVRSIAARLSATTQEAAEAAGWSYVAASAASTDHHAWSPTPWTRRFHLSLRGGAPYHRNAEGMSAVADLVIGALADDH